MSKRRVKKRRRVQDDRRTDKAFEPDLYPAELKLFEVQFAYSYDIAIPPVAMNVRLLKKKSFSLGSVQVERVNGSITIDEARVSSNSKKLTRSIKRIPSKTPVVTADLKGTQPLHYRIYKYGKVVAPVYRSRVTVKFYDTGKTMTAIMKSATEYFNQFLKAYRVASGDPVPYTHEDRKELRTAFIKYAEIDQATLEAIDDSKVAAEYLKKTKPKKDGGMSAGISTADFDMAAKPYSKQTALKTLEYSLMPEHMPIYNEPIIEAIELAHRKNEYGLGIVLLNTAFEAAITYQLIACHAILGYDDKVSERLLMNDHKDLEDKRKVFDDTRELVLAKHGLPKVKRFRGSSVERDWDATTYKKRHIVLHVTNAKSDKITKDDFKKALAATQKAIQLLDVPLEKIKEIRKAARSGKSDQPQDASPKIPPPGNDSAVL